MKIRILSENLSDKLAFIGHAVSSKSQLPVLLNILLEAKQGKIVLSSTDLEIGIQTEISANIEEEGAVTVPAKVFSELITTLLSEKITLTSKGTLLEVKTEKTTSTLQTIPKEEFPKLYEDLGEEIMAVDKEQMRQDFGRVAFAASLDTSRPTLSGVLMKKESEADLLVATDGYRLSLKRNSYTQKAEKKPQDQPLIIPARVIREALSLKEIDDKISIRVSKNHNQVFFAEKNTLLVGRLVEGEFPNYQRIIPTDFGSRVEFDKEEMQKAVKVCSIFARETANIVRLKFTEDKIIVSAHTPSVGENFVEVEARLTGEGNEIAFNARYLLDLFAHLEEKEMVFEMSGPLSPGVFKIKGDDSFLHIIMPIRMQAENQEA